MWIISAILLMIGTVAAVMGISFYIRNREAQGKIRLFIFSYGLSSAVWCISYGLIGLTDQLELCDVLRKIGIIGIETFFFTEVLLATEMSGVKRSIVTPVRWSVIAVCFIDYYFFAQSGVDLFYREGNWTTWQANKDYSMNRLVHAGFIAFGFLVLITFWYIWNRNSKEKRLRRFLFMALVSNCSLFLFMLPDFFMPMLGKRAVSTSGLGGAVCAIVMWYGATQLVSFDIRMGNIKEKIFNFMEAGIIVMNMDHQIAMINRYAAQLTEKAVPEGLFLSDIFNLEDAESEKLFHDADTDTYSGRLWDTDGNRAYFVRAQAVTDDYGDPFCYMCVFLDVTDEVATANRLEIVSQAKSRFLAQMSHEIRTPINAVLGMNEMILREAKEPEILDYAENIDSAGNTLLTLINSILDFSKIEDGKMDIVPVRYDTASFINDLVNSVLQKAEAKELSLVTEVDDTLPAAMVGDDVRLGQVIMNLLTNAVKYTEKGSVTLSIRVKDRDRDTISLSVKVKDTGIGIREEDIDRLFISFERLDEVRNHNIEGTGLGISIVKSLLTMMGSGLKVESTYGQGSVFSFVVDQKIADATPIGDYVEHAKRSRREKEQDVLIKAPRAEVLIVDDNQMNLKVAKNLLKLCGINPKMATSGEETIELMRKNTYDIVFLDHMMPGMDGVETLEKLLEEKLVPAETAVIALTANAVVGSREKYLSVGFKDYLSKPIEMKELVHLLKEYLPARAFEAGAVEETTDEEKAPDLSSLGLDTETGLTYCGGDPDFYLEMLHDFVADGTEKMELLEAHYAGKDWHQYAVQVHALKSILKTIGATELSGKALQLEMAAKEENSDYIGDHHEETLQACGKLIEAINALPSPAE